MATLSTKYFKIKGSEGGKKHNAKKTAETIKEKYGKDFYKRIAKLRKKKIKK